MSAKLGEILVRKTNHSQQLREALEYQRTSGGVSVQIWSNSASSRRRENRRYSTINTAFRQLT
jgi:hypothetical protein